MSRLPVDPATDQHRLAAVDVAALVASGATSVEEVVSAALDRAEDFDRRCHGFVTIAHDAASAAARELDRRRAAGDATPGPLFGVPVTVKDNLRTRDIVTTGGSRVYAGTVPAEDAVVVERLRRAGCVVIGKTNLSEFGMAPHTVNDLVAPGCNPWDPARTCGGSSGGAAASVAAGVTPIAVGTDAGGSLRLPAAWCGALALHPGHGVVPRHGALGGVLYGYGIGPVTRTVGDAALCLQVIAGADPRDGSSLDRRPSAVGAGPDVPVDGLRLGWVEMRDTAGATDARVVSRAHDAALAIETAGGRLLDRAEVVDTAPWWRACLDIMTSDRYALLGDEVYGDETARSLLTAYGRAGLARAATVTGADYARAVLARGQVVGGLHRLLDECDLLAMPTVSVPAPRLDHTLDPGAVLGALFPVNLAGFPAVTVPAGLVDGLPVGLHLVGRPGSEGLLLRACRALELHRPWADLRPSTTERDDHHRAQANQA